MLRPIEVECGHYICYFAINVVLFVDFMVVFKPTAIVM